MVETATQRFGTATDEIRKTAGTIREELEATRAELSRGVLDMPAEAKESTTAIRRAVTEQINALKELSEIVARSGRTLDVAEPRPARPAPPPAPEPARRAPQPAMSQPEPALRGPLDAAQPAPRAAQPRRAAGSAIS